MELILPFREAGWALGQSDLHLLLCSHSHTCWGSHRTVSGKEEILKGGKGRWGGLQVPTQAGLLCQLRGSEDLHLLPNCLVVEFGRKQVPTRCKPAHNPTGTVKNILLAPAECGVGLLWGRSLYLLERGLQRPNQRVRRGCRSVGGTSFDKEERGRGC